MLIFLFVADRRDGDALTKLATQSAMPLRARVLNSIGARDFENMGPMIRLLQRVLLVAAALYFLWALSPVVATGFLFAIPLAAFVMGFIPRLNIAGHVQVAATEGSELQAIRDKIDSTIREVEDVSKEVIVVGHSQGGYLGHDHFTRHPSRGNATFIGVGSGLRPITLLRHMRKRAGVEATIWTAFVSFCAATLFSFLTLDFAGPATLRAMFEIAISRGVLLYIGLVPTSLPDSARNLHLSDSFRDLVPILHVSYVAVASLSVAIGATLAIRRWGVPEAFEVKVAGLQSMRWLEVSSPHDPVGRSLWPTLGDRVHEYSVPITGNPVADHIKYFGRISLIPWILGGEVLRSLRVTGRIDAPLKAADVACYQSGRRQALRTAVLFTWILIVVIQFHVLGGETFMVTATRVVGILIGLYAVGWIVVVAMEVLGQSRLLTKLSDPIPLPEVEEVPTFRRMFAGVMVVALGLIAMITARLLSIMGLEEFSGLASLHGVVTVAYGLLIIAGYRPRPGIYASICLFLALSTTTTIALNGVVRPIFGVTVYGFFCWLLMVWAVRPRWLSAKRGYSSRLLGRT